MTIKQILLQPTFEKDAANEIRRLQKEGQDYVVLQCRVKSHGGTLPIEITYASYTPNSAWSDEKPSLGEAIAPCGGEGLKKSVAQRVKNLREELDRLEKIQRGAA